MRSVRTSRLRFLLAVATCLALLGCTAGARRAEKAQRTELASYRMPAYLWTPPAASSLADNTAAEDEFEMSKKELQRLKAKWQQALNDSTAETFFSPDSTIRNQTAGAAADRSTAVAALKNRVTLQTLEALVLVRHPGIKAAENRYRAALEGFDQVANLDEILRQYTALTEGVMAGVGPMRGKEPPQMRFPFPGVLALKGRIVAAETRVARESLEIARRDAVTSVRRAYWNLTFTHAAQRLTRRMISLLANLEAVVETRYQAGRTSFQDVIKVRIKRQTLQEELITLQERRRNQEFRIKELLNLNVAAAMGAPHGYLPVAPERELDGLFALAVERRQELRRLRAKIEKTTYMLEMAETMIIPAYASDLTLYSDEAINQVGSQAMREPFPTTVSAERGVGLPKKPWQGTNDAYLRQTRQSLAALRQELNRAENETATLVRNAWFKVERARREVDLYGGRIVELSQAALDVSTRGYEAGQVSFADVIESYTLWWSANLTRERKKADLGIAVAELERTLGASLI